MKTIKDFENAGEWVVYGGGGGYELDAKIFDVIDESEDIVEFYHDQENRYVAIDIDGNCGYFYRYPKYGANDGESN